jgi:methylmalonyl-CoA carboxyltransferase 12S subunit
MTTVLLMLLSGAAGFWAAARNLRHAVDERFAELQRASPNGASPNGAAQNGAAKTGAAKNGASAPAPLPVKKPAAPVETIEEPAVTPEVVMLISAAIAAYLGKHARVKSIRRIGPQGFNPWSQQGRVTIQASHNVMWSRRAGE